MDGSDFSQILQVLLWSLLGLSLSLGGIKQGPVDVLGQKKSPGNPADDPRSDY